MSEEMAEKRERELAEFRRKEELDLVDRWSKDICPNCGTPTSKFLYLNRVLLTNFGLMECTSCGVVFCPEALRKEKISAIRGLNGENLVPV